jgi:hypothetical protein
MFILLLFYCWLLVSTSMAIMGSVYTKKLKMLVYIVQKHQFYGIQFTFICSLYNYYQPFDVLSVVGSAEILYCEYYGCIYKILNS